MGGCLVGRNPCQLTQDAIFNLLVILFYIPQSKSSQVYRKTFYRANDFHSALVGTSNLSLHEQVVTAGNEATGNRMWEMRSEASLLLRQRTKFHLRFCGIRLIVISPAPSQADR